MSKNTLHVGLDIGSTTIKTVVLDDELNVIYSLYRRHFSDTRRTMCDVLEELINKYPNRELTIALTGSGTLKVAEILKIPFVQEVVACKRSVERTKSPLPVSQTTLPGLISSFVSRHSA